MNGMNSLSLQTFIQNFTFTDSLNNRLEGQNLIAKMKTKRSNNFECNIFTFEYNPHHKIRNIAFILSLIRVLQTECNKNNNLSQFINLQKSIIYREICFLQVTLLMRCNMEEESMPFQKSTLILQIVFNYSLYIYLYYLLYIIFSFFILLVSTIPRCGVIRQAININLDDNF